VPGSWYATEIKEFAISFHFYSPKAYMFLRKYLSLPHPSTIRAWSAGIDCEPGFLKKPLSYIANLFQSRNAVRLKQPALQIVYLLQSRNAVLLVLEKWTQQYVIC